MIANMANWNFNCTYGVAEYSFKTKSCKKA